ncbi:MAG: polyhydroxyalkanoate depolymerase, partial [Pseudoxanthomonas sp.]|nr:polyhydroxyalkanoate depolymerase [Pseudoxanthomonas sp.]
MTLYQLHELGRAWMAPLAYMAEANARIFSAPTSWLSNLPGAERIAAGNELVHRIGKDYEKPAWEIREVEAHGRTVPVVELEAL